MELFIGNQCCKGANRIQRNEEEHQENPDVAFATCWWKMLKKTNDTWKIIPEHTYHENLTTTSL